MDPRSLQTYRLAIGLAQGLFLFALQRAYLTHTWPATDAYFFAPLLSAGFFIPLIATSGLGNVRPRTLSIWLAIATLICICLSVYDIYRMPGFGPAPVLRLLPSVAVWLAALLFIADKLVVAGDRERRCIATYPALFDVSWKHGIQALLTVLFVAILWGILVLGAQLFALIKVSLIARMIAQPLFWIPVTALATAYALHVADIRAGIVKGARNLVLILLSWLLPVMTVLAIGFILTVPFTGLETLWNTKRAAAILLTTAGALVFLINATYRDDQEATAPFLRYCRAAAAVALVLLVALAGYAVLERIDQHGLTPGRVTAVAVVIVAACYALGYAAAVARTGLTFRGLEPVNVGTAFVIMAILLALMTPVADPLRLSVNSQLARLQAGEIAADKFDYVFLRQKGGRYGSEALAAMAANAYGPVAAANAERVRTSPSINRRLAGPLPPLEKRLANVTVTSPKGAALPPSLLEQDWRTEPKRFSLPNCITGDAKCDAALIDLDGDGKDEVLLVTVPSGPAAVFKQQNDASWRLIGTVGYTFCAGVREGFDQGDVRIADPLFKDVMVGGQRLSITNGCAPRPPAVRAAPSQPTR
ncbi:MAG: DUF4153 domain-containing protein [Proteobacteria bacterium]|nr:DUF4153 domain-containing protein [Pseudomonadota bacterium]